MNWASQKRLGLYLHVPFCRSKCLYCDFCSFPSRKGEELSQYAKALCRDLTAQSERAGEYMVDSVYLGGGTPTVLSGEALAEILQTVFSCYRVTPDAEITVECNPATDDPEKLLALRRAGANRLSIGLQSAHASELRTLGRLHTAADFSQTVVNARRAGFENISVDVMSGIPDQTLQSYLETLRFVCRHEPTHVSAYGLIVEPDTPFGKMGDRLRLPDEEAAREMYLLGNELLAENGFLQYEISNFAKAGFQSRHNLKYWDCEEFLGFGPAAYSDFGGYRFGNSRKLAPYLAGESILEERERPTENQRKNEYVMLRMRTARGVVLSQYRARFGEDFDARFGAPLSKYIGAGLVQRDEESCAFTPEGMYVSNAILSEILDFEP